jgi:long-chain acyl-CoA synthetase
MARQSVLDFLLAAAVDTPQRTAVLHKVDGLYRSLSWKELLHKVDVAATGLLVMGVDPGDRVVLMAATSLQWVVLDLAIISVGAVTVPVYASLTADEVHHIADNSGARFGFAETAAHLRKFASEKTRLPNLRRLVQLEGAVDSTALHDGWGQSYGDFLSGGHAQLSALADGLGRRRAEIEPQGLMSIIYTSGTTGRPKGVMTTHDNMLSVAEAIGSIDLVRTDDIQLIFLPLAHVFAKALVMAWLVSSHTLAFAQSVDSLREDLLSVRPTVLAGVPRIFEKFYAAVLAKGKTGSALMQKLLARALHLSGKAGEATLKNDSLPLLERWEFALLQSVVFRKVGAGLKQSLGGRMRVLVAGGAPLSPKIAFFFDHAGLLLLEGWGLTETGAASCVNRPTANRIGSVGTALPNVEVRCAHDGELLLRGRGVMPGYWQNPQATAEVLQDGWFTSGDLGSIDSDGTVRILDRKKDLIVTAGGKNVAPQNLENLFKTDALISQVVVHGDRRKFLSALITLDAAALRQLGQQLGLGSASYAELTARPEVATALQRVVDGFNGQLARYESIKKFKILDHDFTQESGELTPSLKIKRKLIEQRYKTTFDSFYDERF